jgi:hypothetical protein
MSNSTLKKHKSIYQKNKSLKKSLKNDNILKKYYSKYYSDTRTLKPVTFATYCLTCVKALTNLKAFREYVGMSNEDRAIVLKKINSITEQEINATIQKKNELFDEHMLKFKNKKGGDYQLKKRCENNETEENEYYDFISMTPLQGEFQKIGRYCYNKDTIRGILNVNNGIFVDPYTREEFTVERSKKIARKSGIGWKKIWVGNEQITNYQQRYVNQTEMREHAQEITESIFSNPRFQFVMFQVIYSMFGGITQATGINIYLLINTILSYRANFIGSNTTIAITFFHALFMCGMYPNECGNVVEMLMNIFEMLDLVYNS